MAGGFIAGAGQEIAKAATEQEQNAFTLKLQSAKLEQEHQNRISEATNAAAIEAAKYTRESKVSSGVSSAASKLLGANLGDLSTNDSSIVDALVKGKIARDQANVTSSPINDEVGIPQYQVRHNVLGFQVGAPTPEVDYSTKRANYDKLTTYNTLLTRAQSLFNDLSVHNAMGAGWLANKLLPENLAKERAELGDINKQLGPLSAGTIEGVPGGRFSQMLGEAMSGAQPLSQHDAQVANDHVNNAKLMIYSKIRDISPVATMPQELTDKFAGLLHDQDGKMINAHDVTIVGNNVYYAGSAAPVGQLNSPFLAVHPHAAQAFAKHVSGQAVQQAGQSKFGTSQDAAAWLKANQ